MWPQSVKIGDRVRFIAPNCVALPVGSKGTVCFYHHYTWDTTLLVKWDNYTTNSCWVSDQDIELLTPLDAIVDALEEAR